MSALDDLVTALSDDLTALEATTADAILAQIKARVGQASTPDSLRTLAEAYRLVVGHGPRRVRRRV